MLVVLYVLSAVNISLIAETIVFAVVDKEAGTPMPLGVIIPLVSIDTLPLAEEDFTVPAVLDVPGLVISALIDVNNCVLLVSDGVISAAWSTLNTS